MNSQSLGCWGGKRWWRQEWFSSSDCRLSMLKYQHFPEKNPDWFSKQAYFWRNPHSNSRRGRLWFYLHRWRIGQVRAIMKQEGLVDLKFCLQATGITAVILLRLFSVIEWFRFAFLCWKHEEQSLFQESMFLLTYSTQGLFDSFKHTYSSPWLV